MTFKSLDCVNYKNKSNYLKGADFCLYLANAALGYRVVQALAKEGNTEIEYVKCAKRVEKGFLRVLCGLAAFTLLLPFTFVAFLIKYNTLEDQQKEISATSKILGKPINGLSTQESDQISSYVKEHLPEWQALAQNGPFETIRIPKETSGLPRTLHITLDNEGILRVMVLCKRKQISEIGRGAFKGVTLAIDWLTGAPFAYSTESGNSRAEHNIELVVNDPSSNIPVDQRHVKKPSFGHLVYVSNTGKKKCGFFDPLYERTLQKLLDRNLLTADQKIKLIGGLIYALVTLEKTHVVHRDIAVDNVFIADLNVILADFGISFHDKDTLESRDLETRRDAYAGKKTYFSPEKQRVIEIAAYLLNEKAMSEIMDASYLKYDIWTMGLLILSVLENNQHYTFEAYLARDKVIQETMNTEDRAAFLLNDDAFLQSTFHEKSSIVDPQKKTNPFYLLPYHMLQYDYRKRPSASQLKEMFEKLKAQYKPSADLFEI